MNIVNQASEPFAQLVLAHGAGAGKDSDFMNDVAERFAQSGVTVVRFDFPYMQTIAETGKKRPPDRAPVLISHFQTILDGLSEPLPIFIGGKSMGGRMATLILESSPAIGAVVFGYPFHPPGKPEKLRTEHLQEMTKPVLVLQGERDTFGKQEEVSAYGLSERVTCEFFKDGDHSLKPRKASGLTQSQHIEAAVSSAVSFMKNTTGKQS